MVRVALSSSVDTGAITVTFVPSTVAVKCSLSKDGTISPPSADTVTSTVFSPPSEVNSRSVGDTDAIIGAAPSTI